MEGVDENDAGVLEVVPLLAFPLGPRATQMLLQSRAVDEVAVDVQEWEPPSETVEGFCSRVMNCLFRWLLRRANWRASHQSFSSPLQTSCPSCFDWVRVTNGFVG